MYRLKTQNVHASEIAKFLGRTLTGTDCVIRQPSSLENVKPNSILFVSKRVAQEGFKAVDLRAQPEVVVIVPESFRQELPFAHIASPNPRLDYVRVLNHFFAEPLKASIHATAVIEKGAVLGKDVFIGAGVYISAETRIGDRTQILANVVITGPVEIGSDCVVKAGAVLGSEGFSFVTDSERLEHFPQLGKIVIGDRVWIGSNSCVERAAIDVTLIEDDVKIDDLVQVGHNTIIGRGAQLTAGTIICGRARIGARAWLAPNVCVNSDIKVGEGAFVGMSAVVLHDVEPNMVVAGNPAKVIKKKDDLKAMQ